MNSDFAKTLKDRRKARGLTQSDLATQSGVSLPLIQIIESQRGNPTLEVISKLLKPLGLNLTIQSPPTDWGYLIKYGLPLTHERGDSIKSQPWDLEKFAEQLKLGFAEVLTNQNGSSRKKDALIGLLLAISEYYPKTTANLGLAPLAQKYKAIDGRHIKLKRIALARVQKYL